MDKPKELKPSQTAFRLHIPEAQYQKIMHWVNRCDNEVSGFGSLDYDNDSRTFTVRDVILVKQTVTKAETEMDAAAIGKAMYQLRDEPNALKWHWHSHGRMGVFWSATDRTLIRQLSKEGWLLATVFNQDEKMLTAFAEPVEVKRNSLFSGPSIFHEENFIDEIETTILLHRDPALLEAWNREFDTNVKEQYSERLPYEYDRTDKPAQPSLPAVCEGPTNFRYNKAGYVTLNGKAHYNPCFDEDIEHSEFAINCSIDEMSSEEVKFMADYSPTFKTRLDRWRVSRTAAFSPGVYA